MRGSRVCLVTLQEAIRRYEAWDRKNGAARDRIVGGLRAEAAAKAAAAREVAIRQEMERIAIQREAQARYEAWLQAKEAAKDAKKAAIAKERAYFQRLKDEMAGYDALMGV